jgi:hypothetical protein
MARAPDHDPAPVTGDLGERTRQLLARFDGEEQGYAFDDAGDGTRYATWFADLLDEYLALT